MRYSHKITFPFNSYLLLVKIYEYPKYTLHVGSFTNYPICQKRLELEENIILWSWCVGIKIWKCIFICRCESLEWRNKFSLQKMALSAAVILQLTHLSLFPTVQMLQSYTDCLSSHQIGNGSASLANHVIHNSLPKYVYMLPNLKFYYGAMQPATF